MKKQTNKKRNLLNFKHLGSQPRASEFWTACLHSLCIVEWGAGKWTINGFVCKFIYKKYTSSRLFYWLTNLYMLQIQNMYLHMYVCTTSTLHGFEKQSQHKNALFLWTWCDDTVQWLVQLLCEQGQSQCDTRGHSGASSAVVFLFFNLQCAGTAGWGRSLRPPSFFAIVLHAGDGISQLTWVSWKKKEEN